VTPTLHSAELPDRVYRLGREPDPWAWPDWSYASPDGTFGNRFDDPEGQYRVLYAGIRYGSRLGDELSNWAIFEPNEPVDCEQEEIEPDDPDLVHVLEDYGLTLD
jgi:hypothetical protein